MFRCKPGDQAIVIRSRCGNQGREVSVIRLLLPGELFRMDNSLLVEFKSVRWLVEARHPLNNDAMAALGRPAGRFAFFDDSDLLPINPPPAAALAAVPSKEAA